MRTRNAKVPDRGDRRKAMTKATGATAITFLNRSKFKEALEKPAVKKRNEESEKREAARRAMKARQKRTEEALRKKREK